MRTTYLILLTVFCSLALNAQDITKVLFIGNSITFFNDMPQTFEDIANSKGDITKVTMYAPGGTGFIDHVDDPNVLSHFQQGNWDYVVLQPGLNESIAYSVPTDETLARAKILKDLILHYSPCAKILYYELPFLIGGKNSADLNNYNDAMNQIRTNMEYLSDELRLFFAPAGEVVRTAWNNNQSTMFWDGIGDAHPNPKGSYIIACTLYASIFQKPSYGTNITGSRTLSKAISCQQLADTIVLNNLSDWRINTYNQHTEFDYFINQSTVTFTSTSQNIDSLHWDFGNGNTSNLPVTTHNYNQTGIYNATLTTYKEGCIETINKSINIMTVGLENVSSTTNPNVYPNPFCERIIVENNMEEEFSIFNFLGQDYSHFISIISTANGIEVDTKRLPKGTYVLKTKTFANIIYKQ